MDTGATKLGFASYELSDNNFPGGVRRAPREVRRRAWRSRSSTRTSTAYAHALAAGCTSLAEPQDKPQSQRVA